MGYAVYPLYVASCPSCFTLHMWLWVGRGSTGFLIALMLVVWLVFDVARHIDNKLVFKELICLLASKNKPSLTEKVEFFMRRVFCLKTKVYFFLLHTTWCWLGFFLPNTLGVVGISCRGYGTADDSMKCRRLYSQNWQIGKFYQKVF